MFETLREIRIQNPGLELGYIIWRASQLAPANVSRTEKGWPPLPLWRLSDDQLFQGLTELAYVLRMHP